MSSMYPLSRIKGYFFYSSKKDVEIDVLNALSHFFRTTKKSNSLMNDLIILNKYYQINNIISNYLIQFKTYNFIYISILQNHSRFCLWASKSGVISK